MTSKSRSSSPSDLSEPPDDLEASDHDMARPPPSKRRRLGNHLLASPTTIDSPSSTGQHNAAPLDDISDVSSDSDASVPGSPRLASIPGAIQDEDAVGAEQMRLCSWDGCNAGELANQDDLVDHVHKEHVNNAKKAKFACEWTDCKAKGKAQMSAYALRAHIRSHTKEKPFYCLLPECDKCFTRSDALAKHMRTVHENESVRTSEHYPRRAPHPAGTPLDQAPQSPDHGLGGSKAPKSIKLHFKSAQGSAPSAPSTALETNDGEGYPGTGVPLSPASRLAVLGAFPEDLHVTPHEAAMPRDQLFALWRRQIYWAELEAVEMAAENAAANEERKQEWLAKELVLENLLEAEIAGAEQRGLFKDAAGLVHAVVDFSTNAEYLNEGRDLLDRVWRGEQQVRQLPINSPKTPWYRQKVEVRRLKNGDLLRATHGRASGRSEHVSEA